MYEALMTNDKVMAELDVWNDVCIMVDLSKLGGLGGSCANPDIPERFAILAELRRDNKITYHQGIAAILGQQY